MPAARRAEGRRRAARGASFRRRAAATLALAIILPAVLGAVVIGIVLSGWAQRQVADQSRSQAQVYAAAITALCTRTVETARALDANTHHLRPSLATSVALHDGVTGAVLLDARGRVLHSAGDVIGTVAPSCDKATGTRLAFLARLAVPGPGRVRTVVVEMPAEEVFRLVPAPRGARVDLLIAGNRAASVGAAAPRGAAATVPAAPGRPFGITVVLAGPSYGWVWLPLGGLALVVAAGTLLAAGRLATMETRPLRLLADAADEVAAGRLDVQVPLAGADEAVEAATAFNAMSRSVSAQLIELGRGREELRRNLERLGQTLAGTLDIDRILAVVLDTAMASTGASVGAVILDTGAVQRRLARGRSVSGVSSLSVPFGTSVRTLGAIELQDKAHGTSFSGEEVSAIRVLAQQAAIAVENVLLHDEAQRLSVTDGLTGLWNRRYLLDALRREVERAERHGRPLAVLVIDLDRFKAVNDVHGHGRGDEVLVEVASRLRSELRDIDIVARYGGEEFVLVLPETDAAGVVRLCERLCTGMRERPFNGLDGPPLQVTLSVGAALLAPETPTGEALLHAADLALYAAKADGRDCWRLADADRRAQIRLHDSAPVQA